MVRSFAWKKIKISDFNVKLNIFLYPLKPDSSAKLLST